MWMTCAEKGMGVRIRGMETVIRRVEIKAGMRVVRSIVRCDGGLD